MKERPYRLERIKLFETSQNKLPNWAKSIRFANLWCVARAWEKWIHLEVEKHFGFYGSEQRDWAGGHLSPSEAVGRPLLRATYFQFQG